jgi:hypothetical protein
MASSLVSELWPLAPKATLSPSAQAKRLTLNPQTKPYTLNPKPKGDLVALGQEVNPKPTD